MSDLSLLSVRKRKSEIRAVRSPSDPELPSTVQFFCVATLLFGDLVGERQQC
jgi:hypothetical protein